MSYTTTTRTPTRAGWLVSLMLVTFAIGTDDFVIAGILPDIADDPAVSEAAAGQLVTVFSITYALAAPPLAVATARLPRTPMVVGGLSVFAAVNLMAAIAPSYAVLMALRVVAALIAAMVSPAVFGMAARLAAPGRDGRALGVVAGLTVSLFIGVPYRSDHPLAQRSGGCMAGSVHRGRGRGRRGGDVRRRTPHRPVGCGPYVGLGVRVDGRRCDLPGQPGRDAGDRAAVPDIR